MTRKAPTPAIRSFARRGEDGPWTVDLGPYSPFVIDPSMAPPLTLADRYTATARWRRDMRALLAVTLTDRETGATFGWTARGNRVTLSLASDATAADVARLWSDGHTAVGLMRRQTGGPAPDTGLTWQAIVEALVARHDAMPSGEWATEADLADDRGVTVRWLRKVAARAPGPATSKPYAKVLAIAQERVRYRAMSSG